MTIIPAIDILGGKCVRLTQGDYNQIAVYSENPVDVAKSFESAGLRHIHIVDLDGARSGNIINFKTLEAIASQTNLIIDFGGGIKSDRDIRLAFDCGANQITAGSIAVKAPEIVAQWLQEFGPDRILLGADCSNLMIATNGWIEDSEIGVMDFIADFTAKGATSFVCTDIAKDGMLEGPSVALYGEILSMFPVNLIASGGIRSVADLEQLREIGCSGAIIGKAIYENRITLEQLSALC